MEESNYIYGLDISLSCTGVAIFDLHKMDFVYVGSIDTEKIKKKKNHYHNALKLAHINDKMSEIIELYPPREVSIERGFSRFNTATQTIFRAHGVINYRLMEYNQVYYPPKKVKSAILHGDATKKQVATYILNRFPMLTFVNEDESDACAVALCHLIEKGYIEWEKPDVPAKKKKAKAKTS